MFIVYVIRILTHEAIGWLALVYGPKNKRCEALLSNTNTNIEESLWSAGAGHRCQEKTSQNI